ncbi:MAG TPA: FN3 domain-containing metallophosphoesterase family protein [Bacteroidales bacterium]|nr:FN3 domain-containing metallophosphoesterase family protein [Bacteroidales bacterium]
MKKVIVSVIFLACLTLGSFAQDIVNDDFIVTHGPYIQNLTSTGVTIVWATNKPAIPGVNIIAPDGTTRFVRNSHYGKVDGGGTFHKVRIDGLTQGTKYQYGTKSVQVLKYQAYKIYYGDTLIRKSETFTTPSNHLDKINFTVVNDVHELSGKFASYLKNGNSDVQDYYFFNGDMVNFLQNSDQLFTGFIDTATAYFAGRKPFYYIRGNHETRGYLNQDLKNYFDYKDGRFYYSMDLGPVHFIILDCGEDKPDDNRYYYGLADFDTYRTEELEWLKKEVLSDEFRNAKYKIVLVHIPIVKGENQGHGTKFLADNFGPVLKAAGIDLMISGHIHRNAFYDAGKSGLGYPVLVNSNNSFVEVAVDNSGIKAIVKDISGKQISEYTFK